MTEIKNNVKKIPNPTNGLIAEIMKILAIINKVLQVKQDAWIVLRTYELVIALDFFEIIKYE